MHCVQLRMAVVRLLLKCPSKALLSLAFEPEFKMQLVSTLSVADRDALVLAPGPGLVVVHMAGWGTAMTDKAKLRTGCTKDKKYL